MNQHILAEYESLKKELHELYEQKGRGAIFRCKVRWIEKGEKPTKYFFNLEKKNYEKRIISQLSIGEEEIVSDFKQINKEIERFFTQFYKSSIEPHQENAVLGKFQSFVESLENSSLSEHEIEELEHNLSIDKLHKALKLKIFITTKRQVKKASQKNFMTPSLIY